MKYSNSYDAESIKKMYHRQVDSLNLLNECFSLIDSQALFIGYDFDILSNKDEGSIFLLEKYSRLYLLKQDHLDDLVEKANKFPDMILVKVENIGDFDYDYEITLSMFNPNYKCEFHRRSYKCEEIFEASSRALTTLENTINKPLPDIWYDARSTWPDRTKRLYLDYFVDIEYMNW